MLQGLVGATESSLGCNNSAKGSKSSSGALASIAVGDSVVRGPAWNWGEDDGGPGGYGTVIDVRGAVVHVQYCPVCMWCFWSRVPRWFSTYC